MVRGARPEHWGSAPVFFLQTMDSAGIVQYRATGESCLGAELLSSSQSHVHRLCDYGPKPVFSQTSPHLIDRKSMAEPMGIESRAKEMELLEQPELAGKEQSGMDIETGKQARAEGWRGILSVLEERGKVEFRGCTPIAIEDRTEANYTNIFTLWFSMSCNPLP